MKLGINLRLLSPGRIGGMEVYVRNLLHHMLLIETSLQYLLFTTAENGPLFDFDEDRVKKHLVDHENYNRIIKEGLRNEKVDLYFCPLLILEPFDVDIPSVINIPDVQHEVYPEFFTPEILRWRKEYFGPSARRVDAVLTLSDFSKQMIADRFKIHRDKIHAIHLSADNRYQAILEDRRREEVRKRYDLPEVFGFYPANTWPHKNHRNLVLAVEAYRRKYGEPPPILLTGAQGEWHRDLLSMIKAYHQENLLRYVGYVEKKEMPALYGNATFLVFPSLFEGFGMPVLEAMHMGCPVTCSKTTSLPEIAGEAALYFDPEAPEQIADAMHTLATDEKTRRHFILTGKDQIQKYSWEETARKTLQVFRDVQHLSRVPGRAAAKPWVTIVTPSFNQGIFIEDTIRSVLSQDYPRLEYIVVDGGSTDQTLDILRKYADRLTWISEPDRGQADAVNKGMRMAKGSIIGWLNSDDSYLPGAVGKIVDYFTQYPDKVMVYGEGQHVNKAGQFIGRYPTFPFDFKLLAERCFVCQPTVFLRSEAVAELGYLNEALQTCMDYDLWIRMGKSYDNRIGYLEEYLANSRLHQEAKTFSMREVVYKEIISTVNKHYGYTPITWVYGYIQDVLEPKYLKKGLWRNKFIRFVPMLCSLLLFLKGTQNIFSLMKTLRAVTLRRLGRRRLIASSFASVAPDGWVSGHCEIDLKNPMPSDSIRIAGRHVWPYASPLKIKITVNGITLSEKSIRKKGPFTFELKLPERMRELDPIRLVIDNNKTFIPRELNINEDGRALSFILDKVELHHDKIKPDRPLPATDHNEMEPLVSIITPSYNQGKFIEETLTSVLSQDYPNIEYIIVDGGSRDGTLDILKKYGHRLVWISEPDQGQSDAINKGFRMAKGEIVAWLNADDIYLPGAVKEAVSHFLSHPDAMMIYGEGYEIDEGSSIKGVFPATQRFDLWKLIYVWDYILQPTVFFKRSLLDQVGFLDTNLNWCMDWDLWIRIGKKFKIDYVPMVLAKSRVYPGAKTSLGGFKRFQEIAEVMRSHGEKRYPPGYFIYGEDTLESILADKAPLLYRLLFRRFLIYLRGRFGKMINGSQGVYPDGWVERKAHFLLPISENAMGSRRLMIKGFSPEPFRLGIRINGYYDINHAIRSHGEFTISNSIPSSLGMDTILKIDLYSNRSAIIGKEDRRRAAFRLIEIKIDS